MSLPDIIYKGSVKNIRGVEGVSPYIFEYSDRYSVYDWGEMPDHLQGKGDALCFLAWFFFDYLGKAGNWKSLDVAGKLSSSSVLRDLRKNGLTHHMVGLAGGDLKTITLDREVISPTKMLLVHPVKVIEPVGETKKGKLTWDYSAYAERPVDALVPLEVIFRFGVPEGSSLLKRTGDTAYCKEIGLANTPSAGDKFDVPIIEFSTKLENKDRYISYVEAAEISGMNPSELQRLVDLASLCAINLKACFDGIGVGLWDGKLEFAFVQGSAEARDFMLVDSVGPDELRLIFEGVHLSKEILRASYKGSSWLAAVEKAKSIADERGEKDWKRICLEELKAHPPLLSPVVKEKATMIYKSLSKELCKKYCDKVIFAESWSLSKVAQSFAQKKAVA